MTDVPQSPSPAKPAPAVAFDRGAETAQVWMCAFLIVMLGVIVYVPAFSIPFHGGELALFEDSEALLHVATVGDGADLLPNAPLTLLSYGLNSMLPGAPPFLLHFGNVLIHALCGVLVFLVAFQILPKETPPFVALSAGALYVAYLGLAEIVCYLPERPALLAALFALLSASALLRALRDDPLSWGWLGLSLAAYAGAAGAWARAMAFVVVLLWICRWKLGRHATGSRAMAPLAVLATAGLVLAARWTATGGLWPALGMNEAPSSFSIAVAAFVFVVVFPLLRRNPAGLACAWGVGMLVVLPVPHELQALMGAEAFNPLGIAGLALLVPLLLEKAGHPKLRLALGILVAVLVIGSGIDSNRRAAAMADPELFWSSRLTPQEAPNEVLDDDAVTIHYYTARAILANAEDLENPAQRASAMEPAAALLKGVVNSDPSRDRARRLLGALLHNLGKNEEAVPVLKEVLRRDPTDTDASLRLADALHDLSAAAGDRDQLGEALDYFAHAKAAGPVPETVEVQFAMARAALGDFESALPVLHRAGADKEDHPLHNAYLRYASRAGMVQQLRQREEEMLKAETKPGAELAALRAEIATLRNDTNEAFYLLELVLREDPSHARAWALMGLACARMGNTQGFVDEWGSLLTLDETAWRALAAQCGSANAWDAALAYLEFAAERYSTMPLPRIVLAQAAMELGQPQQAEDLLNAAAEAHPGDPAPWIALADMAIAAKNYAPVARWLAQAEQRGADKEAIEERRRAAKITSSGTATAIPRTVIR